MFPCPDFNCSKVDSYTSTLNSASVSDDSDDNVEYQNVDAKLGRRYTSIGTDVPKYLCPAAPPKFPPSPSSGGNQPPSLITHNPAPSPNPLIPAPDAGKPKKKNFEREI